MTNEDLQGSPEERDADTGHGEAPPTADEQITLSVLTMGLVIELKDVSPAALVSEVINRVRREAATDWSDIAVLLRSDDGEPRTLSPHQSLRAAGVQSGDTLIFAFPVALGSGWQEVALFLGTSASAGVVGGAAYDLLKSTLHAMAARWQQRRGSTATPSLDRYEALRIAQACLSGSVGVEDPRQLTAVSIRPDSSTTNDAVTWIVTFTLPDRSVEAKVSVPDEGPEHTMILLDHRPS